MANAERNDRPSQEDWSDRKRGLVAALRYLPE
jgi:hypothetical protein